MCRPSLIQAGLFLGMALLAVAGDRGVINDPDGFTNVRADQRADAAVVAKVKTGEPFEFESGDGDWWKVTLSSGKSGWIHYSRIRYHFTLDEIPEKDEENSEVGDYAKARGFDYCVTARGAAKGELAEMKRFFGITDTDGAASEGHNFYYNMVIHLLGDEKLAAFLSKQPLEYQLGVRNQMGSFEDDSYMGRHFPKTGKLLCRKEMVDWPSPDGRYAIRKVFSDACASRESKITRAELIDKATGKAIADLTDADIGEGYHREGKVMWSPDSQRFAFFSGADGSAAQTVVYQTDGRTFTRTKQPELKLPDRDADDEVKGAKPLWTFVEPLRWEKPDVLVLMHHEYFEILRPDRTINSTGRTYDITRNLTTGEATAKVKRFDE